MKPLWLVWSNEHQAWWRPAYAGYTAAIEEAGRYDFITASKIVADANASGPLPKGHRCAGKCYEAMVLAPEAFGIIQPFIAAGQIGVATHHAVEAAALKKLGLTLLDFPASPAGVHAAQSRISYADWRDLAGLGG
jgi:hypothetical protein